MDYGGTMWIGGGEGSCFKPKDATVDLGDRKSSLAVPDDGIDWRNMRHINAK